MHEIEAFGFRMSVNLIHNSKGYVTIEGQPYLDLYEDFYRDGKPFTYLDYEYGKKLLQGERPDWKCRAGARYLYVDEFGNVQLCASQLGRLGKPILEYSAADLSEHSKTYKGCEEGCSVGCAFRCSLVDDDKPQFVKSVIKGFVKGTLRDSSHRRASSARVRAKPALSDD
jgi:hypothetical protein